jgi:hypothetical protein
MRPNTLKNLFFSMLFLFLPMIVFAQSNRMQSVGLVPFWGPDDQLITDFGEELYKGVNEIQGFRSAVIDMTNLPDDVPEGGFPPYICPSPSLIKTNPIALTGEMTPDPDDDEFWHLRLYLWEMADTRLVFSDEVTAYDREELAGSLPGMLDWLFSWLKKGGRGAGEGDGEGDLSNQFNGRQVFITTAMPLHWIYIGLRFGLIPLRMQMEPDWGSNPDYIGNTYETLNGALTFSLAFFPESVPFFSRLGLQVEGVFNYNWKDQSMAFIPTALLTFQAYRHGHTLITLFGGAYSPLMDYTNGNSLIDDKIAYGWTKEDSGLFLGWTVGLSFGGKLDPLAGVFYIDLRFSQDMFFTYMKADDEGYKRRDLTITFGYQYGIITKK